MRAKLKSTHDECRRHGTAKPRVEAHAAASDGTLGTEWVSTSPARAAQPAIPPLQGLILIVPTQGFGRFAIFALGFAMPRLRR